MWSEVKWKSLSHIQFFATPWTIQSMKSSRPEYAEVGSLSLLQGIFPNRGLNPGLPYCRRFFTSWTKKGSPRILEWLAYPFSSRSSRPRNLTGVSIIAGGFFMNWAIREALIYGIYIYMVNIWYLNCIDHAYVIFFYMS